MVTTSLCMRCASEEIVWSDPADPRKVLARAFRASSHWVDLCAMCKATVDFLRLDYERTAYIRIPFRNPTQRQRAKTRRERVLDTALATEHYVHERGEVTLPAISATIGAASRLFDLTTATPSRPEA